MRTPFVLNARRFLACTVVLALAAACGDDQKKPAAAAAASSASDFDAKANMEQLSFMALESPLHWDFTEGVLISESSLGAKQGGGKAVVLTATSGKSLHRLGVAAKFPDGQRTYRVTVWVKGSPGVDAMLEARGGTMTSPTTPADYGRTFFDLAADAIQANPMNTPPPNFANAAIATDGEWKKLGADMTTRDGWLYLVVNMTTKSQHVFQGQPGMTLTLGGIQATPIDQPLAPAPGPAAGEGQGN